MRITTMAMLALLTLTTGCSSSRWDNAYSGFSGGHIEDALDD